MIAHPDDVTAHGRGLSPIAIATAALVLTLTTLPLGAWFVVHSSPFGRAVHRWIEREAQPGAIQFGQIEFGPRPGMVTIFDVSLYHQTGARILHAKRVHGHLSLDDLVMGEDARHVNVVLSQLDLRGFELTLGWDRFGKLGLVQMFKSRAFGLSTVKKSKARVHLDLSDIALDSGTLHLVWPAFGFTFTEIGGRGSVQAAPPPNGLAIDVPALRSAAGTTWIRRPPARLKEQLAPLLPDHEVSAKAPDGLHIPHKSVVIKDFVWSGTGFTTDLTIDTTSGAVVHAAGGMSFPKRGPVGYDIALDTRLKSALAAALTGGVLQGETTVKARAQGHNAAALVSLGPMDIARIRLPSGEVDDLKLTRLVVDTRGHRASVEGRISVGRLETDAVKVTGADVTLKAEMGNPTWDIHEFLRDLFPPPRSILSWLKLFPPSSTVNAEISQAAVATLDIGKRHWTHLTVQSLGVEGSVRKVLATLEKATLGPEATATGQLSVALSVGLSGITLDTLIHVALAKLPRPLAARLLGENRLPDGERVSGRFKLAGNLLSSRSWTVELVQEDGGP